MGLAKGPSEGGSGGKRGHSGMEHWGYTNEVKQTGRRRRRVDDKREVEGQTPELDEDELTQHAKP